MRPGRMVEVVEMTLDPKAPLRVVVLEHGEDVVCRNLFEVKKAALCKRRCSWCEALVKRCQSRGGGSK